jgi:hypothetical protein
MIYGAIKIQVHVIRYTVQGLEKENCDSYSLLSSLIFIKVDVKSRPRRDPRT